MRCRSIENILIHNGGSENGNRVNTHCRLIQRDKQVKQAGT